MAPPMICCDGGTLCVVVPWLVPDVWQPSAASGVSRLSKGARFYSGMLRAALAATSWACAGLKSRPAIWPARFAPCSTFKLVRRFLSSNHIRDLEKAHFSQQSLSLQMSGFMESVV